jgi:glutamyl-tRNA synthetase/glutamyl-Q tRNA(Asp) synthetase
MEASQAVAQVSATRLKALQAQAGPLVTRFAPSPTGYLHLGHVLNAIYVWGVAQWTGARVLLRIEDHDRQRSKPHYEPPIRDDLAWLGLLPDTASWQSLARGGPSPFRQSDRPERYEAALAHLRARYHVYGCNCSRKFLQTIAPTAPGEEPRYPGYCRERGLPLAADHHFRLQLAKLAQPFDDLLLGEQTQVPAQQCGDLQLKDRKGNWSYQFAVTVDDWQDGVNLVIRGQDLLASTGRQCQLAQMLGREQPPAFLHHPLLAAPDGEKLSKRDFATGVSQRREAGDAPEEILGEAAYRAGLQPAPRPVAASELAALVVRA